MIKELRLKHMRALAALDAIERETDHNVKEQLKKDLEDLTLVILKKTIFFCVPHSKEFYEEQTKAIKAIEGIQKMFPLKQDIKKISKEQLEQVSNKLEEIKEIFPELRNEPTLNAVQIAEKKYKNFPDPNDKKFD